MAPMTPTTPLLNPALRTFWQRGQDDFGRDIRHRVLYGGRSSSKSWDAAGHAIRLSRECKIKVLCARQFQANIAESVFTLLKHRIFEFGISDEYNITDNRITHLKTGSEFIFKGLWRHINEIRSLEGIDICWVEESQFLTEEQWEVLEPTVRRAGSEFWFIFNPWLSSDFIWRRFVINPPPGTIVRHINFDENPFLNKTMTDVIEAKKAEDADDFAHIYLGRPRDDDDDAVIKRSWVMAAIGAHTTLGIEPTGSRRIGFDVADSGADKCATIYAHGQLAKWGEEWKAGEHELLKSTTRVWQKAGELDAEIIYDSIGVGAQVGAKINELNTTSCRITHTAFNAGGAVFRPDAIYGRTKKLNKDMFANIKAQAWWSVADRLKNTYNAVTNSMVFDQSDMIFIDPDIPNLTRLVDELATPKRDFDPSGKVKVESKKDLAKANRIGGPVASPNLADAFIMAYAPTRGAMRVHPVQVIATRKPMRIQA